MQKEIEEMERKKQEQLQNEIVAKHSPMKGAEKGKASSKSLKSKGKGSKGTPKKGSRADSQSEAGFSNMEVQ